VLRRAGLIEQGRRAQWRPCQLDPEPLRKVAAWVEQYAGSGSRASTGSMTTSANCKAQKKDSDTPQPWRAGYGRTVGAARHLRHRAQIRRSPSHVFTAFSDQRVKARCFVGPDRCRARTIGSTFERAGANTSAADSGRPIHTFDAIYHDIVPDRRIVYSYEMHLDGRRISVSLATLELLPAGAGTDLVLAEQDAFLDSQDFASQREQGARELLTPGGRTSARLPNFEPVEKG